MRNVRQYLKQVFFCFLPMAYCYKNLQTTHTRHNLHVVTKKLELDHKELDNKSSQLSELVSRRSKQTDNKENEIKKRAKHIT